MPLIHIFLFFALFTFTLVNAHNDDELDCTHDEINHDPVITDLEEEVIPNTDSEGRLLASKSYPNMRIYPYYGTLSQSPVAYKNYIQNELVPPIVSYLEATLKVKYPTSGKLKLSSAVKNACGYAVPSVLRTGVDADFFIFFDTDLAPVTEYVASSTYCFLSTGSKRPFIAKSVLNRNLVQVANGDVILQERNTYLLIHEIIHTLGFSSALYPYYLDSNGKTRKGHIKTVTLNGSKRLVIDVPELTDKARKYFGCASLEGIYMENNGGAGTASSHLEKRNFGYEVMTSGIVYGQRISQFTLGMLEATGWYVADYDYSEPFFFGQGEGCEFIKASSAVASATFDEFCNGKFQMCSVVGRGGGKCNPDVKTDGVRMVLPIEDQDCEGTTAPSTTRLPSLQVYGRTAGSKCFNGDLRTNKNVALPANFCFTYKCSGSGTTTTLQVNIGKQKVTCTKKGSVKVPGYYGGIDCPDPMTFCNTVAIKYCPRGCMGRGVCKDNVCVCNKGFTGIDCGLNI